MIRAADLQYIYSRILLSETIIAFITQADLPLYRNTICGNTLMRSDLHDDGISKERQKAAFYDGIRLLVVVLINININIDSREGLAVAEEKIRIRRDNTKNNTSLAFT